MSLDGFKSFSSLIFLISLLVFSSTSFILLFNSNSCFNLTISLFKTFILCSALSWWCLLAPTWPLSNSNPLDVIYSLYWSCSLANDAFPPSCFQNSSEFKNLPYSISYILLPLASFFWTGTFLIVLSLVYICLVILLPFSSVSNTFLFT